MTMLDVQGVRAGYRQMNVLNDVTFSVAEGEFLGILGHNGMGKSTLLKAVSGEIRITEGHVRFGGTEIGSMAPHRRARLGLGYVPQGRRIFPALTVRENMMMAALGTGQPADIVERMVAVFPRLAPISDRPGGVLSGGEQQILALARCLCGAPRLLLLDEPTEGIQPSIRDEIAESLRGLRKGAGLTLLLVEQNAQFMEALADRVIHMEKGHLAEGRGAVSTH